MKGQLATLDNSAHGVLELWEDELPVVIFPCPSSRNRQQVVWRRPV
ncbi:hypothetical protein APY03_0581 [Variovorax sp. WDL1]|nr:hypothetical protein APY03_0581 [Variovorax sp. WDL1]